MRSIAIVLALAAPASAQDDHVCPMAKAAQHQAQVDHRHEHTTGVPTEATRHHFTLAPDGGAIRLGVEGAGATEARDRIREHLQAIARAFAAGDFSMPAAIHDQVPPGVETMKARGDAIRFVYSETPEGGMVTLSTGDEDARAAIHEFLRFQIRDHGTGDPTE